MTVSDGQHGLLTAEERRQIRTSYELDEAERLALPPRLHQPVWDDLCKPKLWHCSVCWGEGYTTQWPCDVALEYGLAVAEAMGAEVLR